MTSSTAPVREPNEACAALVELAGARPRRIALGATCVVGRDAGSTIVVDDPMASPRHAEIKRVDDGSYRVVDLGSRRGTFVGGRRVVEATLADGDEILVAAVRLRFEDGSRRASGRHRTSPAMAALRAAVPDALDIKSVVPAAQAAAADEALRRDYQKLRAALEVTRIIGVQHDLSELVDAILQAALQLFPAERATVMLLDERGSPTLRRARSRRGDPAEPVVSTSLVSEVVSTKCGVIVSETDADDRLQRSESLSLRRVRSAMCVPMLHAGRITGILHLECQASSGAFGECDLEIATAVADQAALAAENALVVGRAQAVIEEDRRRLARIVSALPAGVLLLDRDGWVVASNARGTTLLGEIGAASQGPLVSLGGYPIAELLGQAGREVDILVGGPSKRVFCVSACASEEGSETVVILRDATAEREREQHAGQQERLALIGQLAGGVAHDFNNLLAVILSYAEFVRSAPGTDHVREDVDEIHGAATRASELTRQLLAFSRREMVTPRVFELDQLVTDMAKLLRRPLGEDVALSLVLLPDVPPVKADPSKIEQVLMNLAVNARDAMPEGGTLTLWTHALEVGVGEVHPEGLAPGRYAVLSVRDTGVGMAPEVAERVFEPFFTTKERGRGTGLGLAMAYGIVRQAGGSISVRSEPGAGTEFHITLPATEERLPGLVVVGPVPGGGHETILLAEDQHAVRAATRRMLVQAGYRIIEASSGVQALELAARHGTIDLLLTDLVMPGMGGKQLAEELTRLRPSVRVVYMSGYIDGGVPEGASPHAGFLAKPFSRSDLLQRLEAALAPARASAR